MTTDIVTKWVVKNHPNIVFNEFSQAENYVESFIDGTHPVVEICEMEFLAGEILRRLDPESFREILWTLVSEVYA